MWNLNGTTLTNKANIWKSNDTWSIRSEGTIVYIENTIENEVLMGGHFSVWTEKFNQDETKQMIRRVQDNPDLSVLIVKSSSSFKTRLRRSCTNKLQKTYTDKRR